MEDKIYLPQTLTDQAFPIAGSEVVYPGASTVPNSNLSSTTPNVIPNSRTFPEKLISVDTINNRINTQKGLILGRFTFTSLGAISIGKYENGVSGEVQITPNGITAKNVNGTTTFSLDTTTGDATFLGTLQAGTVISGAMELGSPQVVLDGANGRIVVNDGTYDRILIGYQSGGF